ncbi:MAG TPA: protein translocase subunit SecF [Acidimicrobiales bacterium]|nr:protein translocase subunit SecF [Acidimicrobiales bacterium]
MTITDGGVQVPKKRGPFGRLYHGETNIDFIGRTKIWFIISAIFLLIGLGSLFTKGLNLGIDFEGGAVFEVPSQTFSVSQARDVVSSQGVSDPKVQELVSQTDRRIRVQTETLPTGKAQEVQQALADAAKVNVNEVNRDEVGPSWGKEISGKARNALIVFLIVITLYISLRFEFKMALPTLIALVHDVFMTIGIYSLSGLEVTPATVVALLTILGFSIYDGIVVFDKVHENTRLVSATNGVSYGDMVNLSLNQTLMRSLNTSITALIPIASLLIIGSLILGATTLEEFALALLIGLGSGAYSSIFIASPFLAIFKEREPRYRDIKRRIESRQQSRRTIREIADTEPDADGKEEVSVGAGAAGATSTTTTTTTGARPAARPGAGRMATNIPPRPRKKGKRR